jgi:hypothetical protein
MNHPDARQYRILCALLAAFAALILSARSIIAQEVTACDACSLRCQDLDGDRLVDLVVIESCFAGHPDGQILVYDRGHNMRCARTWHDSVDFEDDLWVFDAEGNGDANLIIDFHRQGSRLVAELYDDQNGDGEVAYEVEKGAPVVRESEFPSVQVTAQDEWSTADGRVNFNLMLRIDGHIRASFVTSVPWLQAAFPGLVIPTDGNPDARILVRDSDNDGHPDYEIRQIDLPVPEALGYVRTELTVKAKGKDAIPDHSVFWPYLGGLADYIKPYGGASPPIQVDWQACRIRVVGEFVASRGGESNWFIYSIARFGEGHGTLADFENPFCFYDLAHDQDGYPELMIRSEYASPGDTSLLAAGFQRPREAIRYSWDQDNDGCVDYKVDLLGRHTISDVVSFPEFAVRTLPYAEFPAWVMTREWDTCVFVAAEGKRYGSTEGIYEGYVTEWYRDYVTGIGDEPALAPLSDVRENLRLEYTPQLLGQPWLYVSSIDHKLHVRGAWAGVWRVDQQHRIRYDDLDGDGRLDQWVLTEQPVRVVDAPEEGTERPLKSLQVTRGFVLYTENDCVSLVKAEVSPSVLDTLPPHDHQGWLILGQQLEDHHRDWAADDLKSMAEQFSGPATNVQGGSVEGFRLTGGGFRFVLHLHPGSHVPIDDNGLGLRTVGQGSYVVDCETVCQLRPLTPSQLSLSAEGIVVEPSPARQLDWTTVRAVLHNSGLRDVQALPVRMYAVQEDAPPLLLAEEEVSVPAEGSEALVVRWAPPQAGHWTISVEADAAAATAAGIQVGAMRSLRVYVQPVTRVPLVAPSSPYDIVRLSWPALALLGSASLAALAVLGLILSHCRTHRPEGLPQE